MSMKRRGTLWALLLAVLSACAADDGQVRGRVTTEAGAALAGVQVRADGTDAVATSDAQGEFTLSNLRHGGHTLVASHADYVDSSRTVEVQGEVTAEVSFTLTLAVGQVTGTVRMEDKSSPAGVVVSIPGTEVSAVTDAQGAFRLPSVLPGARTVVAHRDHYTQASRDLVVVRDETHSVDFVLTRAGAPSVTFPMLSVQGGILDLSGGPFGRTRGESTVTVGGVPVAEYLSWADGKISARVAASVASGDQPVKVMLEASWRPAVSKSVRILRTRTVSVRNAMGAGIRPDGTLVTWGQGPAIENPPQVGGVVSVALGTSHSALLMADGSVMAWGNEAGAIPRLPVGNGVAVACAGSSCFVLRADGTVFRWSASADGNREVPGRVRDVVGIEAGQTYVVVVTKDGFVDAWGDIEQDAATVPVGLAGVVEVATAGSHTVVLRRDGTVTGWGSNFQGESSVPTDLKEVISVGGGIAHSYALTKSGQVHCWGGGDDQCNLPTEAQSQVAQVVTITDGLWGMVLKQDGTLVSWRGEKVQGSVPPPQGLVLAVPPL
ncbi:carboxypeptidase regulatory-like domain-containing protein [Corallococcus sp. M7]